MRITKNNTIGLVIDIQERLFPVMWEKERLLKNCGMLLGGLTKLGIPLLTTQQYTKGLGETLPEIRQAVQQGAHRASLEVGDDLHQFKYIEKKDFSCCDEPVFAERLEKIKAKNIIICGIESHVCVLQTAIDMKDAGLNPIVVMDCVSSRTKENIELAKERFRFEGIMMTSYESILFELTRSAGTSAFKAISKLVK